MNKWFQARQFQGLRKIQVQNRFTNRIVEEWNKLSIRTVDTFIAE